MCHQLKPVFSQSTAMLVKVFVAIQIVKEYIGSNYIVYVDVDVAKELPFCY